MVIEPVVIEFDVQRPGGRTVHGYDSGPPESNLGTAVFWHHGTPQVGAVPPYLLSSAAERGLRWLAIDRAGYGGSTAAPDRDVASVAADVAAVADEAGIDQFAVLGASGGGPHALACAALFANRVTAVISAAGLAPFGADGLDWYGGMAAAGEAELRAAASGRAELAELMATAEFDPEIFTPADHRTLGGVWGSLGTTAEAGMAHGLEGLLEDDLAYVKPWGFELSDVSAPILLLHGTDDRVVPSTHGQWLARHLSSAELWLQPGDGHVSILEHVNRALDWLSAQSSEA